MKIQTFRERLGTDANYAISYIVYNNYDAVADNLRTGFDFSINSDQDVFDAIQTMLDEGEQNGPAAQRQAIADVVNVLSVPMNTEGVDPAQVSVVAAVAQGLGQMGRSATVKSGPFNDLDNDNDVPTTGTGSPADDNTQGSGNDSNNWFTAIMNGFATVWLATNPPANVNQVDTTVDAALAAQQEAARKARTTRIIIIGAAVVVLVIVLVLVWKKWGKG